MLIISVPADQVSESLPLFSATDPTSFGDIVLGNLMNSVFVFLDWAAFTNLVKEEGADLFKSLLAQCSR